jgi:hypothetical protein
MARRRTVTIVSGEDLTGEQHADRGNGVWGILKTGHPAGGFHLGRDTLTTVKDPNARRAEHSGQWR